MRYSQLFGNNEYAVNNEISRSNYYNLLKCCDDNEFGELTADAQICYAAKSNSIVIRSDGIISKCTVNFEDCENNFGNICLINNEKYNLKEYNFKKNKYNDNKKCIDCCLYPICFNVQCPARKIQFCKEIYAKSSTILAKTKNQMPILFE